MSKDLKGKATGIEVIQDPYAIQKLYANLVNAAKKEVLLFLPTTSSFLREKKIGIIQSLIAAAERGVKIHVLTPAGEEFTPEMNALLMDKKLNIGVRRIRHKSDNHSANEARTKIIVIDKKEYLIVELKDDTKETFVEAVRLAIYSNTQSTVRAYLSLFESLWEQGELYDQLEAQENIQNEFINIAAHELRTPIQPILGMIEMWGDEFNGGSKRMEIGIEDYELLLRNARRLERLANTILEASRIESNTMKLNKERFDMNEKIRNIVSDVVDSSKARSDLDIIFKNGEPLIVEADKVRIFEVISNLLENAIKFTQRGAITIKTRKQENEIQVEVKDTGKGINKEILPRLFSKFATKSEKGTGLGLYISKSIIEAHGGRMWAENNNNGKGATFSFTLPLADTRDPSLSINGNP